MSVPKDFFDHLEERENDANCNPENDRNKILVNLKRNEKAFSWISHFFENFYMGNEGNEMVELISMRVLEIKMEKLKDGDTFLIDESFDNYSTMDAFFLAINDNPYHNLIINLDDFLDRWFNPYRKNCFNCDSKLKIHHYGECLTCMFSRENYNDRSKDYKFFLTKIRYLDYNEAFLNFLIDLYKSIPKYIYCKDVYDHFYKENLIQQKRMIGKIIYTYAKQFNIEKCGDYGCISWFLFKGGVKRVNGHRNWNTVFAMMIAEDNIQENLNFRFVREERISEDIRFFDFVDLDKKIVIEVDDSSHSTGDGKQNDAIKNKICTDNEYKIFRICARNLKFDNTGFLKFRKSFKKLIIELRKLQS